ncbi:squamosa promoter-binding 8 [Chlorella sorokiniana]|uniref:Squamosa promoter-binding 8 n=1 Tax=Chlorella sorokiniana TaxID=3076 RepID=A0A2P6TF02_CHLSO|nr:squamosa promoter-binding 8 [Chlorella sorokiniana]|eukprot:PRW32543.1 squamosa promoter-binding 8 [Chlorella sorokiniana]
MAGIPAPSRGSAEGQGSQPWSNPGGSESSDAGGAKAGCKSSVASGKKSRRSVRAPAICQVEGCGVNLENGKPFYRLQRICERHARAAVITDASGAALRFCQQCTRLHPLEEFEGAKRSCVASLQRRMARKQRQQAVDKEGLEEAEAAGKRRTRVRSGSAPSKSRAPASAAAAGGSGGGRPDSGGTPQYWSSNSHGSGSYGDTRSQLSGGSGGASGGVGGTHGLLPLGGQGPDLTRVPGMVPQPLPHSGPLAAPPLQLPPMGMAGALPAPQLQHPGGAAGGLFNFALDGQPVAAAAQPLLLPAAGLMDWAEPQSLLSPGTVRRLLQDDALPGAGSTAALAPAPAPLAPPAANPAAGTGQTILSDAEVERLLVMDPDDLAGALLSATEAGTDWPLQQRSEAGLGVALPAGSGSAASGSTTARGLASSMSAPQQATGLGPFGLPAASTASGSGMFAAPAMAPQAATQWGNPEQLRQRVLGLDLSSSPPKPAPGAGAAAPAAGAAAPAIAPMPASTGGASMQQMQLPPSTLPLANWAGAQPAVQLLNTAAAPVEHAAGDAFVLPPEAELVVIRFALKMYGLYPDQLPPQLQVELQEAVTLFPTVLHGAVRSGCTHLTASLLATGPEAAALDRADGAAAVLSRLLRSWKGGAGRTPWRLPPELPLLRVVAQAENASAALLLQPLETASSDGGSGRLLAAQGGTVCPLAYSVADERLQLSLACPPATTIGAAHGLFRLRCADLLQLLLAGEQQEAAAAAEGDGGSRRVLHCRARGRHVAVSLFWPGHAALDGDDEESSDSPSPHTPVVRSSRGTPVRDEERLQSVADVLWQAAGQPGGEQSAAEQLAAGQQQAAAAAAEEQQEDAAEGSEAASPVASERESDSEAEAAEESLTLRLLHTTTSAEAWVPQALRQWGLYEFELAQGARLGPAVPVLVLPDSMAAIAAELCQLSAAEAQHPGIAARVLRLLSFVLLHLERQRQLPSLAPGPAATAAQLPPSALARLAAAARWLCALCVRCRWPALLRALLPAATACGAAPAEAVAAMDRLLPAGLLASAAAANSAPLLQALGDWAAAAGHTWQPEEGANSGMTALHYAAALGPSLSAEAAAALLAAVGAAQLTEWWQQARAYGWTPRMVAEAASNRVLASLLEPLAAAAAAGEEHPPSQQLLSTAAVASSSGSGGLKAGSKPAKATAAAAEAGADEAAALLLQEQYYALELEKKGGRGEPVSPDGLGDTDRLPRLPASAAELQAWQRRPLSPALLALVGAAAIVIVVGLSAALRAGWYD